MQEVLVRVPEILFAYDVTVGIVREHDGWTEILFADGEKGWIRTNLIEIV